VVNSSQRSVLLVDGDCALCTRAAIIGRRLRLNCEFTPLQTDDLEFLDIDHSRVHREVLFLSGSGTTLYGHEAIAAVLKTGALPWQLLGHVITLRPVNRLSARIYRTVSQHRHRLYGS